MPLVPAWSTDRVAGQPAKLQKPCLGGGGGGGGGGAKKRKEAKEGKKEMFVFSISPPKVKRVQPPVYVRVKLKSTLILQLCHLL